MGSHGYLSGAREVPRRKCFASNECARLASHDNEKRIGPFLHELDRRDAPA
jgi:hypothetical protein